MRQDTTRQKNIAEFTNVFLNVSRRYRRKMEEALEKLPCTPSQHRILVAIGKNKVDSQKDLAKELDVSTAAIAVSLNKLEKAGLIKRTTAFDDSRKNLVSITEQGKAFLKTTRHIFSDKDEMFFRNITDEELETMTTILKKLDVDPED